MICPARCAVVLLLVLLVAGCTTDGKPRGGEKRPGDSFEYTAEFVQNSRGNWEPSSKPGKILAVTRWFTFDRSGRKLEIGEPASGDAGVWSPGLRAAELLAFAEFEGSATDCEFGGTDTGSYVYVAGRHWPRQKKHWVDATCDATTIIMQQVVHADGSQTDRVFLLWDGRPPTDPPSQVTVSLINNPAVSAVLTCGALAQECYVETSDGLSLSGPFPLHPGPQLVNNSASIEAFVDCVKNQAAQMHINEALQWQQLSKGRYKEAGSE